MTYDENRIFNLIEGGLIKQEAQMIEELLRPRYQVIADYPGSNFKVNQVITLSLPENADGWDRENLQQLEFILPKYPHLFRPLHWSELRDEKDLPEYVKSVNLENNKIGTAKYDFITDTIYINDCPLTLSKNIKYYLPATEQDYTEYINKNK